MKQPKAKINDSKIHSSHYSLMANIRKAPWVSSTPLFTAIRASIVIYTLLYMALVFTPLKRTKPINSYRYLLRALYHVLFPLSTILTSITGVDILYIFHLLLLSVNMDFFQVVHSNFSKPGFVQTYCIISIIFGVANFVFFFYWSIPNRLVFINTFQIGVEVKAQAPYNVLKRIGLIWLLGFILLLTFTLVIPIWPKNKERGKLDMYMESEPYLRFTVILIIEYLMYKQCHPLHKYELKNLFGLRSASDIIYSSITITSFLYFSTIFISGMTGLGVEWFLKHDQTIQLINVSTQVVFFVRFYFLWHLSVHDLVEELSKIDNAKPDYPQWSWDWIPTKK